MRIVSRKVDMKDMVASSLAGIRSETLKSDQLSKIYYITEIHYPGKGMGDQRRPNEVLHFVELHTYV